MWQVTRYERSIRTVEGKQPPLKAEARKVYEQNVVARKKLKPREDMSRCVPPGTPRVMWAPLPMMVLQTPRKITLVHEYQHLLRHIYMDEPLPPAAEDLDPSYMGESVGRWEGDTLVVETLGLNDKTVLDREGMPHSTAMRVTERLRLIDGGKRLEDLVTIDDAETFTAPWTARIVFERKPGVELKEYNCVLKHEDCIHWKSGLRPFFGHQRVAAKRGLQKGAQPVAAGMLMRRRQNARLGAASRCSWLRLSLHPPAAVAEAAQALPEKIDYNWDVRPILSQNCFRCHGLAASTRKAGLRLDVAESAYGKLPEEPDKRAIVPGRPEESELVRRITSTDVDERMPPKEAHKVLSPVEHATLVKWIEQGAEYKQHWAYIAPARSEAASRRASIAAPSTPSTAMCSRGSRRRSSRRRRGGGQGDAHQSRHAGSDRPAAHARGSRRVRRRQAPGRLRASRRPLARRRPRTPNAWRRCGWTWRATATATAI